MEGLAEPQAAHAQGRSLLEVKSGEVVKSASLRYCAGKFPNETPLRVRLSMRNLSLDGSLLNVPLYLADHAIELASLAECQKGLNPF